MLDPLDYQAYNNRGLIYGRQGNYGKAIENFDKAVAVNPTYAVAYDNRGQTHYFLNQFSDAIDDFDRAIQSDPKNAASYLNRGKSPSKDRELASCGCGCSGELCHGKSKCVQHAA